MADDDIPIEASIVPPTPPPPPEVVMESRDVLDSHGNVLGQLSFPEGTSEDIWIEKIAEYAVSHTPTVTQIVDAAILSAIQFGTGLADQYKRENVFMGITQAGKTHDVLKYLHFAVHCMESGSLYGAIDEINILIADTSDTKAALSPFVTNDRMTYYKNAIQAYLKVPLT